MRKLQSQGVHHITIVGADRQTSIEFWEGVLGMPFVFEQPNLDRPEESHLYFDPGDGRLITIFTNDQRTPDPERTSTEAGAVHHVAFSGFIPTVAGWEPDLGSRPGLPVFIAHGRRDPIMDVEFARRARALLGAGGLRVEYHESDAAHHIDPAHVPAAIQWLAGATAEHRSGTTTTTTEGR